MNLLLMLFASTLAVLVASYVLPGIKVDSVTTAVVVAIVLGLVNMFIRPLVVLLTLPVSVLTLGLFLFVINALMVLLVANLVPGFRVAGFWWALLFSLVVSLVGSFLSAALNAPK